MTTKSRLNTNLWIIPNTYPLKITYKNKKEIIKSILFMTKILETIEPSFSLLFICMLISLVAEILNPKFTKIAKYPITV